MSDLPEPAAPAGEPTERTLHIEVWADVVCPWCYLAKHRLERALHAFEHPSPVDVRYRSFQLDPQAARRGGRPVLELLGRRYGGGLPGARRMMQRVVDASAEDGLVIDPESMISANSFDAHRLVQLGLASGGPPEQSAVLERLYSAHFAEGRAIDDVATLQRLAAEAGLDERRVAAVLAADDYADQVHEDEALASRLGIRAVPHLVAGDVVVSGAQSLDTVLDALRTAWDRLPSA